MRLLIATLLFLGCSSLWASPVRWDLQDVVFDDGAIATGYFIYDGEGPQPQFLEANITVTGGTSDLSDFGTVIEQSPFNYTSFATLDFIQGKRLILESNSFGPDSQCQLTVTGCSRSLQLDFAQTPELAGGALPDGGGSFPLALYYSTESFYITGHNEDYPAVTRTLISGYVTSVPVPAAAWLFGSALAGLGWIRRKQTV
jgi:hypothetical protein